MYLRSKSAPRRRRYAFEAGGRPFARWHTEGRLNNNAAGTAKLDELLVAQRWRPISREEEAVAANWRSTTKSETWPVGFTEAARHIDG